MSDRPSADDSSRSGSPTPIAPAAEGAAALRWWWETTWSTTPLAGDEWRLERHLGWSRVVAGIAVLASSWRVVPGLPDWAMVLATASGIGLLVTGVVTRTSVPVVRRPRRLLEVLSLLDAILLSMVLPFGAAQDSPFVIFLLSVIAILGALRLGRLGVFRNLVIAAPFETVRLVLGASMFDNRFVEDTVIAVVVAAALGSLVADVATTGRRASSRAAYESKAAHGDRVRLRRLRWEADVLDDIVRTAGTGASRDALGAALGHLRVHLHLGDVHLFTAGAGGQRLTVRASTDPDLEPGTDVDLLPGGPHDRALSLGTVAAATHDDLTTLAGDGPRSGSIVAAPLPIGGHLLGLVVAHTPAGDLLHHRDAHVLGQVARALAPFVRVAMVDGSRDQAITVTGSPDRSRDHRSPAPDGDDGRPVAPAHDGTAVGAAAADPAPPATSSGEERVHEGSGLEGGEVVDALPQSDQLHG